jgi:hypothetical protein
VARTEGDRVDGAPRKHCIDVLGFSWAKGDEPRDAWIQGPTRDPEVEPLRNRLALPEHLGMKHSMETQDDRTIEQSGGP